MLRWSLLILLSAGSLGAQFRWKCDPKDGKFTTTLCATCKKMYCWDGQIFSEEEGYTPPPSYVLAYWEEVARKSQQIRADIERRGKELADQVQAGKQETARLNQDRALAHKEFMDDLNRRIAQSRSGSPPAPRAAIVSRAVPTNVVAGVAEPAMSAPALVPSSRAKVSEIQVGMDRATVEGILGRPHSSISVPDDDGLVESLSYMLEDHATARVRIERGKVASVKIFD
jgi:hypothetical protein